MIWDDLLSYNSSPRSSHLWFSYIHNFITSKVYSTFFHGIKQTLVQTSLLGPGLSDWTEVLTKCIKGLRIRHQKFQELETITSRMRRLFQAGTGSLYSLSPECFRLPFGGVTCSFPPLNGAPRPRPLLPCLLRWSTSHERKRDSVHTKTKKTWRISREWIWELNFSAWVGNTRYVLLFWRALCISVTQRNTSFRIGTRT